MTQEVDADIFALTFPSAVPTVVVVFSVTVVLAVGFIMLIVIAIIISLLKFVPAIVDSFKSKPEEQNKESVEKAIENIVAREEAVAPADETDDTELVAVIAAAIAASEGAASVDGFVVRSIRRIR